MFSLDMLLAAIGLIGALCPVTMYFMLEMEKVDARSLLFYMLNALGSVLIITASAVDYDPGNIGILVMEGVWLLISLKGVAKVIRQRKSANA